MVERRSVWQHLSWMLCDVLLDPYFSYMFAFYNFAFLIVHTVVLPCWSTLDKWRLSMVGERSHLCGSKYYLNTFSSIAFFHLSQPQAPVSSGWHIHCQKLLCKWSSSLHNGRPRWHSCWTLSCSCSGCCVPCCRRPPQCSVEPPQRDPTCWGEYLSCSQLRFEDSWEYRVLETCKKKKSKDEVT